MDHVNCNCDDCHYARFYTEVCPCCGVELEKYRDEEDNDEVKEESSNNI